MNPSAPLTADVSGGISPSRALLGLTSLSLSVLLSSFGASTANVALPSLASAFGLPFGAVQWVVLAYLVVLTASIVGVGRLGDTLGRGRVLTGALVVFAAAALVGGVAESLWLLIAARAVQGIAGAAMMALPLAAVGDVMASERIGSAMGLLGATSAVGTALGPSLGGALIAWLGWRAPFLLQVPLGLLAAGLARRALPAGPRARSGAFDLPGALLLAGALSCYALAVTVGQGRIGALNLALGLGAAALGALLYRSRGRSPAPILSPALSRVPGLRGSLAASLLVAAVVMATLVVGPFHLTRALGLGMGGVGLATAVGPLVAALAGVPAGRLVDRVGTRRATLVGLGAVALGAAGLAAAAGPAVAPVLGVSGYVGPVAALTAGYALFQAANNTSVIRSAGAELRGVVSGALTLSRNLGLVTGASVMGAIFAAATGTHDAATASAAAVAGATRITFAAACGLSLLAIVAIAASASDDGGSR